MSGVQVINKDTKQTCNTRPGCAVLYSNNHHITWYIIISQTLFDIVGALRIPSSLFPSPKSWRDLSHWYALQQWHLSWIFQGYKRTQRLFPNTIANVSKHNHPNVYIYIFNITQLIFKTMQHVFIIILHTRQLSISIQASADKLHLFFSSLSKFLQPAFILWTGIILLVMLYQRYM